MGLILDSSVLITAERQGQNARQILAAISSQVGNSEIALSVVTLIELAPGAARADTPQRKAKRQQFIQELLTVLPIHPVTVSVALRSGQIDGENQAKGVRVPLSDLLMLRDASYVFNRFEEASAGVKAEIDTSYPAGIRNTSKEALSGVVESVEIEKPKLNALLGHSKVSSVSLLDVYNGLDSVASELQRDASEMSSWGDQKLSVDLAQLSAKASVLSARVATTLRSQIAAQELQLASCAQKTPARNPK
jgi:predicted nucleic acid-binding protein